MGFLFVLWEQFFFYEKTDKMQLFINETILYARYLYYTGIVLNIEISSIMIHWNLDSFQVNYLLDINLLI